MGRGLWPAAFVGDVPAADAAIGKGKNGFVPQDRDGIPIRERLKRRYVIYVDF
jgi:hypothetical protein